jgi:hypothetical protein
MRIKTVVNKCVNDKHGKPVLFQAPNAPLSLWIICVILGKFTSGGAIDSALDAIGFVAIFTWAWLEIFKGESLIRRFFGVVVMVAIILSRTN